MNSIGFYIHVIKEGSTNSIGKQFLKVTTLNLQAALIQMLVIFMCMVISTKTPQIALINNS